MINKITGQLLSKSGINNEILDAFQSEVLACYEKHGFFKYTQLEQANPHLGESLTDIIIHYNLSDFVASIFSAAEKESLICVCLCMEMFGKDFDPLAPVYESDRLNLDNLEALLQNQFRDIKGFHLFSPENKEYKQPKEGLYKFTLYFLHHFCGIKEIDLDSFFDADFQEFYNLVLDAAKAVRNSLMEEFFSLMLKKFLPDKPAGTIATLDDFDALIKTNQPEFILFLDYLLEQFAKIRGCTTAIVETLMIPVHLREKVNLAGPGDLEYRSLEIFNQHIRDVFEDPLMTFKPKDKKEVKNYLEKEFENETERGGFVGLIKRQTAFMKVLKTDEEPFRFVISTPEELDQAAATIQQDTEDLQTLKRINFVLKNRKILSDEEWSLTAGKLVPLLKTYAITYYSDIFELYYFMLMKKSQLEIRLLTSQKKGKQDISTCDYKIGSHMAADAKCLIGEGANFGSISYWLNKVGSQVKNTTAWKDAEVDFGGAVIGIRDKQFPFLDALSSYLGADPNNVAERLPLFKLMYQLYAEFRRHTKNDPEEIKFIVFYYIPATELPATEWGKGITWSDKGKKELMFIISTKYASTLQIEAIKQTFEPVANFLFQFNNLDNMI